MLTSVFSTPAFHRRAAARIGGLALIAAPVAIAVAATSASAAIVPALPDDNLVADPSFELGANAFTGGWNQTATEADHSAVPYGDSVLSVTAKAIGAFKVNDAAYAVPVQSDDQPFTASVWLTPTLAYVGYSVTMSLVELGPDGSQVATTSGDTTAMTSGYAQRTVSAIAQHAGDSMFVSVRVSADAAGDPVPAGATIFMDGAELIRGLAPPPTDGFASTPGFDDTFGGTDPDGSTYDITDNWQFGLTDGASSGLWRHYWPWSGSLSDGDRAPYFGSGSNSIFPGGCRETTSDDPNTGLADQPPAWNDEYDLPGQVSQTSTGASDEAFAAVGTGVTLTASARRGTYAGCAYSWASAALNTWGKEQFGGDGQPFFVQVKAKMPAAVDSAGDRVANGGWGSIWLLPATPAGGLLGTDDLHEIDLQEGGYTDGSADPLDVIASNRHLAGDRQTLVDTGTDLSAGYHTYGAWVDPATGAVKLYFDGSSTPYATYPAGTATGPMFLLLNLQVFNPDFTCTGGAGCHSTWHSHVQTTSDMSMDVAEVQVYQQ